MARNYSIVLFLLLGTSGAFSQIAASKAPDSVISQLYQDILEHNEINREIAIKYLHLDSFYLAAENNMIHSDSLFFIGSHVFAIISYAAQVNCGNKQLIEYKKDANVFINRLLISSICDFDLTGNHTSQIDYKFKGNKLYIFRNYYRIKNEDLIIVRKESTFSVYGLPNLNVIILKKPQQ